MAQNTLPLKFLPRIRSFQPSHFIMHRTCGSLSMPVLTTTKGVKFAVTPESSPQKSFFSVLCCTNLTHDNHRKSDISKQAILMYRSFHQSTNQWIGFNLNKFKKDGQELVQYDEKLGNLVYRAPLSHLIRQVKAFTLFTSVLAISVQPLVLMRLAESGSMSLVGGFAIASALGFFILATPMLIHWVTRKYVTHIYYNPVNQGYAASTISLFLREKRHVFTVDDVAMPTGYFAPFTTVKANKRPLFIDPQFFSSRDAYLKLMRYDEPLDLTKNLEK